MPDPQVTSGMMQNNAMSVNILFTIHGRGAISVIPKSLDRSPNFVELVLKNNFIFSTEIPLNVLFTEDGIIGTQS